MEMQPPVFGTMIVAMKIRELTWCQGFGQQRETSARILREHSTEYRHAAAGT